MLASIKRQTHRLVNAPEHAIDLVADFGVREADDAQTKAFEDLAASCIVV
jgi:hypothetical protein